jgi:hypothetical protein
MEMIIIEPQSPEWDYMWNWLANHPLNENTLDKSLAYNEESGEAWQYMGSFRQNKQVVHEFRHRHHPESNKRELLKVKGSENLSDDQINNTFKI